MASDTTFDHLVVVAAYRGDELMGRQLCASRRELDEAIDRWSRHRGVRVFVDDVERAVPELGLMLVGKADW